MVRCRGKKVRRLPVEQDRAAIHIEHKKTKLKHRLIVEDI
jgi:hypothetical protein